MVWMCQHNRLQQNAMVRAGSGMPREAAAEGNALGLRLRAAARPALGSVAFLAAVEAAWQLHERCAQLPYIF